MTTQTLSLADFLLARITEDEAVARATPFDGAGWFVEPSPGHEGEWLVDSNPSLICYSTSNRAVQEHIARHDPNRVLAECEAKRRIVAAWADEWPEWHGPGSGLTRTSMTDDQFQRVRVAEHVLGLLALPYADHPDYRNEWRP